MLPSNSDPVTVDSHVRLLLAELMSLAPISHRFLSTSVPQFSCPYTNLSQTIRQRSQTRTYDTHVDTPEKTDAAEEDDPAFPRDEGHRNEICNWPHSVPSDNDWNRFGLQPLHNLCAAHALQGSNNDKKGACVDNSP